MPAECDKTMRMQKCPQCGADNSLKRTTCYQCQQEFTSHVVARSKGVEPPQKPAANSRWEALEPVKRPAARPLQESVPVRVERAPSEAMSPPGARPPAEATPRPRPRTFLAPRSSIKHVRQMAQFYRELHSLIRAGITIGAACRELEPRVPLRFRPLARDMGAAAEAGKPLSSALENYRQLIYPWHLGVVRAAESAGSLPQAIAQIADAYEEEWKTRAEIALRVFIYCYVGLPAILLVLPVTKMLQQPIPEEGYTPDLVWATLLRYLREVSLPIGAGLVGLLLVWRILSGVAWFQGLQARVVLALPVFGRVARTAAAERYLSALSVLLNAGVPLSQSMEEAAMAAGNAAVTPRLLRVTRQVEAGGPLLQALRETRVFDGDTLRLAGTGEATGTLPEMLDRAAGYLREQHQYQRRVLLRLSGVAFTVGFGVLVGMVFLRTVFAYFDYAFRVGDWMGE